MKHFQFSTLAYTYSYMYIEERNKKETKIYKLYSYNFYFLSSTCIQHLEKFLFIYLSVLYWQCDNRISYVYYSSNRLSIIPPAQFIVLYHRTHTQCEDQECTNCALNAIFITPHHSGRPCDPFKIDRVKFVQWICKRSCC